MWMWMVLGAVAKLWTGHVCDIIGIVCHSFYINDVMFAETTSSLIGVYLALNVLTYVYMSIAYEQVEITTMAPVSPSS